MDGGGPVPARPLITLSGRTGAYIVIAGSDWDPHRPDGACPNFRRFVITLARPAVTFELAAAAPNYGQWFPDCGPVRSSELLPATALSVNPFDNH
jgi:hypothetical protein